MATLPGHLQALLPEPSELRLERVERTSNLILIVVKAARQSAACPNCRVPSHRIHSRYERTLRDLPWHGATVRLRLVARRFYCRSPDCDRKIFTERLAGVVRRHGRSTERFRQTLALIGYGLGGEAGARLAERMGIDSSGDTSLRTLKEGEPDSDTRTVLVLGVDDWAWRKAQRYGTILVDLERLRPVDLLADRSATSLERWLHDHPGVEVIARDRSNCYAEAATNAAPEAIQVADRFHLLSNLTTAAERVLEQIPMAPPVDEPAPVIPPQPNSAPPVQSRASQLSRQRRQRRVERYNEVMRRYKEGHSQKPSAACSESSERLSGAFCDPASSPNVANRSGTRARSNSFASTSSSAGNRAATMPLSSGAKSAIGATTAAAAWLRDGVKLSRSGNKILSPRCSPAAVAACGVIPTPDRMSARPQARADIAL